MQLILYYSLGMLCMTQLIILGNRYFNNIEPIDYKSEHWLVILICSLLFPFCTVIFLLLVLKLYLKNIINNLINAFKTLILILLKPIF